MSRILLLTPPLLQTNTPYPATTHLTGFLESKGFDVHQRDLSIKVVRDVLLKYGDETTDELLELLSGPAPAEAKLAASAAIDDLALAIRDEVDDSFGFSRYAERISAAATDFGVIERLVKRRGVIDAPLERHLKAAIAEIRPTVIGVTCPFPGTLVAAFKIARYVKRRYPGIRLVLGGGFVSTELRSMTDKRPHRYFDEFHFDEGYANFLAVVGSRTKKGENSTVGAGLSMANQIPAFVKPSYRGIDWAEYFDVVETVNPMHRLWSVGRWVKLQMSRGCYWHRCAFCDVKLPYIAACEAPDPKQIVDAMESFAPISTFHFVDEAMPPKLVEGVCRELLRRRLKVEWWGNIRFDLAFTPALTRLMARAGCIAVTGGLECANDRLLRLMMKGITLASAKRVLARFRRAGILVHAYLMYGFPTETAAEAWGALDFVRGLFREGLLASAFWHRFALTVHSPIADSPERFGIEVSRARRKRVFALNELAYRETGAPDWDKIGEVLKLALYNYLEGRGLGKSVYYWQNAVRKRSGGDRKGRS